MHEHDDRPIENSATDVSDLAADPQAAPADAPRKPLSPAAERALAEAAARRAEIDRKTSERPTELNGRGGLEPARYGDWEVNGLASDF
jgi:hypothetical protein